MLLLSAAQQSDSDLYIYICIYILSQYGLLQDVEYFPHAV